MRPDVLPLRAPTDCPLCQGEGIMFNKVCDAESCDYFARGIDSAEGGETRSGSTPQGQEPGRLQPARPTEVEVRSAPVGAREALTRVREQLAKAGAKYPVENKGTLESAMKTGLSIALVVVDEELAALSAPPVAQQAGEREALTSAASFARQRAMAVTKEWCRGWDDCLAHHGAALAAPAESAAPSAQPVAWLHDVVAGDGEPDQALSFTADDFPLAGVGGFRSIKATPLHTVEPAQSAEAGRWISVDERLPEKNTEVLVALSDWSIPSTGQYTGSAYDINGWCYPAENRGWPQESDPVVTHWMPLPEVPALPQPSTDREAQR